MKQSASRWAAVVLGLSASVAGFGLLSQERTVAPASQQPAGSGQADQQKVDGKKSENFLRIARSEDGTPTAMQTSLVTYQLDAAKWPNSQVVLVGAVHVGQRAYYRELNRRFRDFDVVLYELVADPEVNVPEPSQGENVRHPVGALQNGMKDMLGLEFQLDHIDYRAKNFVHADMSPSEFSQDMTKRGDSMVGMFARLMGAGIAAQSGQQAKGQEIELFAALFSRDRELKMRRVMAEQMQSMDVQMAGLADASGRSTLVTERNAKCFQVLDKQLEKGDRKVAIFYGAAHLMDMEERLLRDYGATRGEIEWLTAWDLVNK